MKETDNAAATQKFYHGTKADLKTGDLITPGYKPNFGKEKAAKCIS